MFRIKQNIAIRKFTAVQQLAVGFIVLTLLGAMALMLPVSTKDEAISFVDALFTAASAITTTGLGVVDTGSYFSIFGQLIIIILVQLGGLGYMIFLALLFTGFSTRLSFSSRDLLSESIAGPSSEEILSFSRKVILFTLFFELTGTIMLAVYWSGFYPAGKALYFGFFHSVSAFCTAGFMLLPDGFTGFRESVFFNLTINLICICGSIGFYVLNDVYIYSKAIFKRKYPRGFSEHTRLAVFIMLVLITAGTVAGCVISSGPVTAESTQRLLDSSFQVITASTTTGFNTVAIGALATPFLWILIVLMFIGSGPGSTGGGIKTTTFGIILLSIRSTLTGRQEVLLYRRNVPVKMIMKAYSVAFIGLIIIALVLCIMLVSEGEFPFQSILFEITSAFGTVGLSTGITPLLSGVGKVLITLVMLIGRIGPVAIGYSLIGKRMVPDIKYPGADILIG